MNIQDCIYALLLNSFLILGVYKLFQKDMLLGFVGDWLYERLPEMVCKPFFTCPPCMSSVYGTGFFFVAGVYHRLPVWSFPIWCVCLCGLVTMIMFIESSDDTTSNE